jgi:hypothetical protein
MYYYQRQSIGYHRVATGTGTYTYSYDNGGSYGSNSTLTVNDNGTTTNLEIIVKMNGCCHQCQTITLQPLNSPTDLTFSNAAVVQPPQQRYL